MPFFSRLPILLTLIGLLVGGTWLLNHSEAQARDTIRKHHLEDIEQALYFAYRQHGTYPPYNEPTWCGHLDGSAASAVTRDAIEAALREQHEKYANPDKPFPVDPLGEQDYFYWKRSPAVFELYSVLEADPNNNRSTARCRATTPEFFDYGLNSRLRTSTFSL